MKRYPNGVEGDFFHQKRVPPHPDFVGEQFVQFPSGHSTVFAVVDNAAALAWVVNLGCIELHTWHSRVDDIERPDYLLIDLDPSEGNPWEFVREIALVVKEVMDELGLASYPKTSGATGLHILAPIRPELPFPEVRRFAKALAEEVERRVDDQDVATTTWRVADRRGVFVDFGQNARDRTIASAYSVRPDAGCPGLGSAGLEGGRPLRPCALHGQDDAQADREGRRPDRRDVAAQGEPAAALRAARPRARQPGARRAPQQPRAPPAAGSFGLPGSPGLAASGAVRTGSGLSQQLLDGRVASRFRFGQHLVPGAVLRVLVGPEADELRAVPEAVALELVEAHLDDELRPHGFQSSSLPRDQRLWPPGIRLSLSFPGAFIFGSSASSSRRTAAGNPEQCPTKSSEPSSA